MCKDIKFYCNILSNYSFLIYLQKKEQFFISGMKIIHAKTCNLLGCCEVTYGDGTTDILTKTIGELYEELNATGDSFYPMVGRSAFICADNVVKIYPAKGELILAYDLLSLKHLQLVYSSKILRDLRGKIFM